jgi:hypothetical protein
MRDDSAFDIESFAKIFGSLITADGIVSEVEQECLFVLAEHLGQERIFFEKYFTINRAKVFLELNIKKYAKEIFYIVLMLIPVIIAYLPHEATIVKNLIPFLPDKLNYKISQTKEFNIKPSFVSTFCAIIFYASFFLRYKMEIIWHKIILYVLNILFCASLMEIFVGKEIWNIPFINLSSQSFLFMAIIMSWMCMRAFVGFIWMAIIVAATFRIAEVNLALGSQGVVYLICASISIIGQMREYETDIISSFKNEFFATSSQAGSHIKGDISEAITATKKASATVTKASIAG